MGNNSFNKQSLPLSTTNNCTDVWNIVTLIYTYYTFYILLVCFHNGNIFYFDVRAGCSHLNERVRHGMELFCKHDIFHSKPLEVLKI
jgi:hypothetical protein